MPRQRIIITGGPGAGKTTLLHALRSHGYAIVDETARAMIQDRRRRGLSPRPSPLQFAEDILHQDIEKYNQSCSEPGLVFFDRSILDALGMLDQITPLSTNELNQWIVKYPYCRQAFFLPPWQAIYTNDAERDQTFAEAIRVYDALTRWYRRCEYEVIEVPKAAVAERCAYVLQVITSISHAEHPAPD